jgi:hypothetical protein
MIERYWHTVGGALFLEFPLTKQTTDSGLRRLDGLIVPELPWRMWPWREATDEGFTREGLVRGRHIIAVQAKYSRLGMTVMGQTLFSVELLKQLEPASVRGVALCLQYDAILGPIFLSYPNVAIALDTGS